MASKGLAVVLSSVLITGALCLSGCASGDMKSMDDSMDKPMMKDSGKKMDDSMEKHDDMGGAM